MGEEAMSASLTAARERLVAAKLYMRYDYAWKETEFRQAESRLSGVACRLLYLHTLWRAIAASKRGGSTSELTGSDDADASLPPRPKVVIDANGYAAFHDEIARACTLMDYEVVDPTSPHEQLQKSQAQFVFVYVSPHGEERVADQYATFKTLTAYHNDHKTESDARPLFCFLLGEAAFLAPPATAETERLRGLSGFAISQRFTPLLEEAAYKSISQFAIEYTPEVRSIKSDDMSDLMNRFGCMDHNVMEHVEKWEIYAPADSVFTTDDELTEPSDDEVRYWLERTHQKACNHCHLWHEKLLRCSRCGNAFYCSRECQKGAWKLHKQLCGKTAAELEAQTAQ